MTMKRTEKSDHSFELMIARNTGHAAAEWAAPSKRRAMLASEGHARMTDKEYREHRMGRKTTSVDRRDVAIERLKARRSR